MQYPVESKYIFSNEISEQLELVAFNVRVDTCIPDYYFVAEDELQYRINRYQDILNFSRPIMNYFNTDFKNNMHLTLIDLDGCVLFSLEDRHIGAMCPGFQLIQKNKSVKESLIKGAVIDMYSEEANENLVCMPMNANNMALYLAISNMQGKISADYLRLASYIYQILYTQYNIVSQIAKATDSLLELSGDYALLVDENGCITNLNRKCLDLFGVDSKEFLKGINVRDIFNDSQKLFNYNHSLAHKPLKLYAQNKWQSVEILHKEELDLPGACKQYAFLFKPASRYNMSLPITEEPKDHSTATFGNIITSNPAMQKIVTTAQKASRLATTVLIEGESGTGKEMIAQGIHVASGRKGPFVVINCGGLPRELLQSELFGYADGAFTGAKKGGKIGKFMQADGGTIFLDEIGEMPQDMQVSLLRFLQDKVIIPLADNHPHKVDVRVIAATNKNLRKEVEKGNFREDLYYRLNVLNLKIPPLRERKDDIPILVNHILHEVCEEYRIPVKTLSQKFINKLLQYDWPGNVRELHNLIERALVVSSGDEISVDDLFIDEIHSKEQIIASEKLAIMDLLERYDRNISAIAKAMGIARTTLYRKMKNLNIEIVYKCAK